MSERTSSLRRRHILGALAAGAGTLGASWLPSGEVIARPFDFLRVGSLTTSPIDNPAPTGARLPRLGIVPGGGILMSWVEPIASEHRLVYSVRRHSRWSTPVQVARGAAWFVNWADFPSVVAIDEQFWLAHWLVRRAGGPAYGYDILLARSGDAGKRWSKPFAPYRDDSPVQHGFATIFPVGTGAGLVWLDGRDYGKSLAAQRTDVQPGHYALRYATVSRDGAVAIDSAIDDNVCSCCQTSAALTPKGPIVAYRGRTTDEIRDNRIVMPMGESWQSGPVLGPDGWRIAACPVNGPALAARGNTVAAAWFTGAGNRGRVLAALSFDGGNRFDRPIEIDGHDPVGRLAAAWLDDETVAISWIGAPDRNAMASLNVGRLHRDGRLAPPRRVARVTPERQSGFPQLACEAGQLVVAWTQAGTDPGIRTAIIAAR